MYDPHLEVFITAADCGSFLKSSEKLYISANAVTKQINLLENRLGVKLFHRSPQGLALTKAGELIYAEAKKMIRHANQVMQKAQEMERHREYVIHIGVSLMNPADILLEQWNKASELHPNIHLEIVPFEDTAPAFNEVLSNLGQKIDLISCSYETPYGEERCNSFHLRDLPLCIACSKTHRLARKERLTPVDLKGETLWVGKRNVASYMDAARDFFEREYPQVQIKETEFIDLHLFNQIVSSNALMLSASCWRNVHPLLATIPVDWDFVMPYGLIYAKEPSKEVLEFIMAVGQMEEQ